VFPKSKDQIKEAVLKVIKLRFQTNLTTLSKDKLFEKIYDEKQKAFVPDAKGDMVARFHISERKRKIKGMNWEVN
jgi:hypothetical protein